MSYFLMNSYRCQYILLFLLLQQCNGSMQCPAGFTGLQAYDNCKKFFWCVNGNFSAGPQACGPGTLFNQNIQNCDHTYNVSCSPPVTSQPTSSPHVTSDPTPARSVSPYPTSALSVSPSSPRIESPTTDPTISSISSPIPTVSISDPPSTTPSASPSITPCDPLIDYCEFTSSFEVDLAENDWILDDSGAKSSFSIAAREWINACYLENDNDTVYYSFYFINGNAKRGRKGQASGKCKGYDCPKPVSFSAPNKRKTENKRFTQDGNPCGGDILEALQSEDPVFLKVDEISMNIPNDMVQYEVAANISTPQFASAQRNASMAVLEALGMVINKTVHECLWGGTTCNADRRIASIRLRVDRLRKQLRGTIASELGSLEYLEYFDISGSAMKGHIPTELGLLQNMDTLALRDNDLSSSIPTELGLLQTLETLELNNNKLNGTVPNELTLLINLERLYLSGNYFTGPTAHVCFPSDTDFFCPTGLPLEPPSNQDPPITSEDLQEQIVGILTDIVNLIFDLLKIFPFLV